MLICVDTEQRFPDEETVLVLARAIEVELWWR